MYCIKYPACILYLTFCFFAAPAQRAGKGQVHILYNPGHPVNTFVPAKNIGAAFDGHEKGDINLMLTTQNIKAMRSVGLSPLSYRLRTELQGEVCTGIRKETGAMPPNSKAIGFPTVPSVRLSTFPMVIFYPVAAIPLTRATMPVIQDWMTEIHLHYGKAILTWMNILRRNPMHCIPNG